MMRLDTLAVGARMLDCVCVRSRDLGRQELPNDATNMGGQLFLEASSSSSAECRDAERD